jgi:4-amino-4-deoxy-L-arabinose transferase-like glycosyltransferase
VAPFDQPSPPPDDRPESWKSRLREIGLIVAVCLALNLTGNGRVSLWDRDEPRYAGCTREMRVSGDLLHPTFNARPRYDKPILIYWLMLAGTALGGDNPFGARLISGLAGTGTCLVVWGLGRRLFGRPVGLLAALIAATAPIVVVDSKLATTDATLMLLIVACQFALWELSRRPSPLLAGGFWAGLALALLTKGPVGLALIAVSALMSWWWGGPTACWSRLNWRRGLLIFALVAAPWYLAIGLISKGEFYRVALGYHVIRRMTTGIETHAGFPGYYVVGSLVAFYPWSAFLPAALLGAWVKRRGSPALAFLLGWAVGPLVFLECVGTKLIHYYLPAYPACALLVAWLLREVAKAEVNLRRWPLGRAALALLAIVGIGTTVLLLAGVVLLPSGLRVPCVVLAVFMAAATIYAMERFYLGATSNATTGLVVSWTLILFLVGAWLLPAAEPYRISPIVGRRLGDLATRSRATPMMGNFQPPDVVYYLGRPAPVIQGRPDLIERTRRGEAVAVALTPLELDAYRLDPNLDVAVRGEVAGFNIERFRVDRVHLAVIGPGRLPLAGRTPETGVK